MIDLRDHEDALIAHFKSITEEEWERRFIRHGILQHPPITYGIPSVYSRDGHDYLIEREWWGQKYDTKGNVSIKGVQTGRLRVSRVSKRTGKGWLDEQRASAVIVYGSTMDGIKAVVSKLDKMTLSC